MSRIVTLVLVGALSLALIGGSAYILLRPGEVDALGHSVEREQGAGGQGQGRGGSDGVEREQSASGGYGRGGQGQGGSNDAAGQGQGAGNNAVVEPLADNPAETWQVLTGAVIGFEDGVLTVQTADNVLEAHLGPEWYWETTGVALAVGDEVALTGFDEDGEFEVAAVENLTTGESLALREESGRPLWAGRGRRG